MTDGQDRSFDLLSLGSFVVLGLPDGMLGTAWPAMRRSFGVEVGDLGLILLLTTVGSVAIATIVGALIRRLGVPALIAVATAIAALGGTAYATAPGLWLVLTVGPLVGAANGMLDGGLNTAVALLARPRLLNLLHGFYGIGTAAGPLLVTAAVATGSWRPAYLVLLGINVALAVLWVAYGRTPSGSPGPAPAQASRGADEHERDPTRTWSRSRVATVLALGLVVFFVYTGLEVAAGQWLTSFANGHLHLSPTSAGLAAFGYWGALTAVRIGLALPQRTLRPAGVIRVGGIGSLLATAVIWWQPGRSVTVLAFVALGGCLAGVFPALVSTTALRIGARRAEDAIAWQIGAAAGGGSGIAALIGLLVNATSLAVLAPCLVLLAVSLLGSEVALNRLAPIPR